VVLVLESREEMIPISDCSSVPVLESCGEMHVERRTSTQAGAFSPFEKVQVMTSTGERWSHAEVREDMFLELLLGLGD